MQWHRCVCTHIHNSTMQGMGAMWRCVEVSRKWQHCWFAVVSQHMCNCMSSLAGPHPRHPHLPVFVLLLLRCVPSPELLLLLLLLALLLPP